MKKHPKLKCFRCGGTWTPKTQNPKKCPKCNNPLWNIPYKTKFRFNLYELTRDRNGISLSKHNLINTKKRLGLGFWEATLITKALLQNNFEFVPVVVKEGIDEL